MCSMALYMGIIYMTLRMDIISYKTTEHCTVPLLVLSLSCSQVHASCFDLEAVLEVK